MERLKFELEFNREHLLTLLELQAANDLEAQKNIPRLVVIEWAEIPPPKSNISRVKTVIIATIGAMMLAVGLVVVRCVYQWYIPPATRSQLSEAYLMIGADARHAAQRLQRSLRIRENAGA
jgi:hypothetical protein